MIRIKSSIFRNIGLLSLKAAFFLTLIILSGCSGSKSVITTETDSVRYSLISIIHADANYLYHVDGQAKKANDEALKESIEIIICFQIIII